MTKILVITVGGSCQPILSSINFNKPDFIYFVCSDDTESGKLGSYDTVIGKGLVCGSDKPSIVSRLSLEEVAYQIIKIPSKDIDNYNACYEICATLLNEIANRAESLTIIVDYTGGTKSMSGGLLLAGVEDQNVLFSIVTGVRNDLVKVTDGTQFIKTS